MCLEPMHLSIEVTGCQNAMAIAPPSPLKGRYPAPGTGHPGSQDAPTGANTGQIFSTLQPDSACVGATHHLPVGSQHPRSRVMGLV